MELTTTLILAGLLLVILLVSVHFAKKSVWYKKVKSTGSDIGDTISTSLGWITSPYLWLGVFWVIYNPWGHSYFDFVKNFDFNKDSTFSIIIVALGAFLTITSLFFITKAWKKLGFFGHLGYMAFLVVYFFALYENTAKFAQLDDVNYSLHILVFLTVYGAWGMIYPKLSKKTHAEVGVNINTDDVEDMSDH